MTLERFMAITSSMGLVATYRPGGHVQPQYFDEKSPITRDEVHQWMAVWTTSLDEAKKAAVSDVRGRHGWSFSAFYDRPLVAIDDRQRVVVRPWFLAIKGTPLGFYGLIERLLRDGGGDTLRWSRLFGRAIEKLGRTLVMENLTGRDQLEDEAAVRARWGPGKACDLVILGDRWLAVDFVFRRN